MRGASFIDVASDLQQGPYLRKEPRDLHHIFTALADPKEVYLFSNNIVNPNPVQVWCPAPE